MSTPTDLSQNPTTEPTDISQNPTTEPTDLSQNPIAWSPSDISIINTYEEPTSYTKTYTFSSFKISSSTYTLDASGNYAVITLNISFYNLDNKLIHRAIYTLKDGECCNWNKDDDNYLIEIVKNNLSTFFE